MVRIHIPHKGTKIVITHFRKQTHIVAQLPCVGSRPLGPELVINYVNMTIGSPHHPIRTIMLALVSSDLTLAEHTLKSRKPMFRFLIADTLHEKNFDRF